VKNRVEFLSQDLYPVRISSPTIEAEARICNRKTNFKLILRQHPLTDQMCEFLIFRGPHSPVRTLLGYCHAFARFLDFCEASSYRELSGESFAAYTDWLKTVETYKGEPLAEESRRFYGTLLLRFVDWLADTESITPREAHYARLRHRKAFRGSSARKLETMRSNAVTPDAFVRLTKAIRLEYEESKNVVEQIAAGQGEYDITFPLLPFSMLLATALGIRPVEFNHLNVGDLRGDRLLLNPPNKDPSDVWLTPSLMASLDLAQGWMSRYRTNPTSGEPLLVIPSCRGRRAYSLVRFDTTILGESLKKFYRKYLSLLDPDGIPYLYESSDSDDTGLLPLSLSFADFRIAAITEAARHESNPEIVMRFARHKSFATTMKFYIHETHRQWVDNVATYLAPSAELFRISLENKIARLTEETAAEAAASAVPGGHCAQALAGDRSCRRALDCRCKYPGFMSTHK